QGSSSRAEGIRRLAPGRQPLPVIRADAAEAERHEARLATLDKAAGGQCLWRRVESGSS
ncbi:MAG: hypothetical protein K0Q68_3282, partial [Moraxellaceae bacterium]|nr:hypothetical protein [Moraxellaceae bacterium]